MPENSNHTDNADNTDMSDTGMPDISALFSLPTTPLLPPAPQEFGRLEEARIESDAENAEKSPEADSVDPPAPPASQSTRKRQKRNKKRYIRKHPIRYAISTAVCLLFLLIGLAMLAWPAISSQIRINEIYDETEPVEFVIYEKQDVPVIKYYEAKRAPDGPVAGLWLDESISPHINYTYIVGHNPGIFSFIIGMEMGDEVELADAVPGDWDFGSWRWKAGEEKRAYTVEDIVDVDRDTYVNEIEKRFSDEEDVLVLQACVDEGEKMYRVVICMLKESTP